MRRPTTALVVLAVAIVAVALFLRARDDAAEVTTSTTEVPSSDTTTTSAPDEGTATSAPATTATSSSTVLGPDAVACDLYSEITITGTIESSELVETSGLAASRTSEGVLWAHNDSRGGPVLHAFGTDGTDLGAFTIPDAFAIDWEDMAAGPGPDGSGAFLYVGDIGDNFGIRAGVVNVWRVDDVPPAALDGAFESASVLVYDMPDGPHDAEAMFIDPIEPALYLVTKDRDQAFVFRGSLESAGGAIDMDLVTTLFLDAEVSAADITPDGRIIAFRGYREVWMWTRSPGQTIDEALSAEPCTAPSPDERQGESITFDDRFGYFTTSEGATPDIHYVPAG